MKLKNSQIISAVSMRESNEKNKALSELNYLYSEKQKQKYKNVPHHAIVRKRFTDSTANELTACVVTWLMLKGHMAWRQGNEGRYRPGKEYEDILGHRKQMNGIWLPGLNNGASVVASIIAGKFFAFEIKINDKQTEAQRRYQTEVEESGGVYHIVHSFAEFLTIYKNSLAK